MVISRGMGKGEGRREEHTGTFRLLAMVQYLGGMVVLFHFIIEEIQ